MKALVPFLLILGGGLLGLRLYLSYTRNVQDASRAGKILWRMLDIFLIILGAAVGVALVIFLVGVIGQVWQNIT